MHAIPKRSQAGPARRGLAPLNCRPQTPTTVEIAASAALTAVGLGMLCLGGHWLVSGGVAVARRFRISGLVIGMTVVAYGTSTPELAASIAAAGDHGAIILGNVLGSNIANVGMVIGVAAILVPLAVGRSVVRREVPVMIGVSLLLVALAADGTVSELDGALLLGGLAAFTAYVLRGARTAAREPEGGGPAGGAGQAGMARSAALVAAGVGLLYAGAQLTVEHSVEMAEWFGLPERVIGLTVIAVGTSLPELVTSVIAIRRGQADIGIGNIIGSNIYNILMIMGAGAVLGGIASGGAWADYAVMVGLGASLLVAARTGSVGRVMGVCLAASYAAYMAYTLIR